MATYKVHIVERLSRIEEIEATSEEEARALIEKQYDDQEIVLTGDDTDGMGAEFYAEKACTTDDEFCGSTLGCTVHD